MLTSKRIGTAVMVALAVTLGLPPIARALTNSDRGAGIVIYPDLHVSIANGVDMLIQLSNLGTVERTAKCFYINANSHCTTGGVCEDALDCPLAGGGYAACIPGCAVTDFFVVLTQEQPLGWAASEGLAGADTPIRGRVCSNIPRLCTSDFQCPGGTCLASQSNAGTLVPPVPEDPFTGQLYCVEIDPSTGVPFAEGNPNDLKGEASLHFVGGPGLIDVATYNAVGIRALGATNGDSRLSIGADNTPDPEYNACPSVLVLNHLFDGAVNPVDGDRRSVTLLSLAGCTADLTGANPLEGVSTAQFLVFNEFEQRFSTSRRAECGFFSPLSLIDTQQPERSIFSATVAGTVAGQTRIRPVGGGLVGSAYMGMVPDILLGRGLPSLTGYNAHQDRADRTEGDHINIP